MTVIAFLRIPTRNMNVGWDEPEERREKEEEADERESRSSTEERENE